MTYTAVVVAHTARLARAEQLADRIGASTVLVDDGTLGCEQNHARAWQYLAATNRDWCLCVEDDAIPVDDFTTQLEAALNVAPVDVVSLYLGQQRPPQHMAAVKTALAKAAECDAPWLLSSRLLHAVAVATKTEHAPLIAAMMSTNHLPVDEAITKWCRQRSMMIAYPVPSICDHDDTLPSLAVHRDRQPRTSGRTAWTAGTRQHWTNESIRM